MRDTASGTDDVAGRQGKRSFANRAVSFANRVRALPGLRLYFVGGAAAVVVMTTAGAFGTLAIPIAARLLFWLTLIGVNVALWILWFAWRVHGAQDWWPAALVGMLVINAPLPLEIRLIGRVLGLPMKMNWLSTWGSTLAISIALLVVLTMAIRTPPAAPSPVFPKGILWRGGFREPREIAAVTSEDHYCRVSRADGTGSLVHARFGDVLSELSALDGALLRRGQWVAAWSIASIERSDRKWRATLTDGRLVTVSQSCAANLRAQGWM